MLTIQQISDIINSQSSSDPPTLFKRWRDVFYGMSLHIEGACPRFIDGDNRAIEPPNYFGSEYQQLFDRLLLNRHPRESDVTRSWRYSQYRPFTKTAFLQIIELIQGSIFQDTQYSIIMQNKDDEEYIFSQAFNNYDIIQFFNWSVIHIMEDPNGYFLRIPKSPYYETENSVEPDIWFIWSKDVIYISPDEIVFKVGEDSIWVVNKVAIFRFHKVKEKRGGREYWDMMDKEEGGYYAHQFGFLPVDVAGGQWSTQGFYNSWLDKAKSIADDYISSRSAEQLIDKEASHPFITIAMDECPECDNSSGYKQIADELCETGYRLERCKKCHGKGLVSQNPGERMQAPSDEMDKDLIKITNPDVGINEYLFKKNKELFMMLLDALNLLRVDEAQSGVAKIIDQERLYHFISKISNDIFGRLIYNSIRDIIAYRNITVVNGENRPFIYNFKLVKPTQFRLKTAADLLQDFVAGTNAKVPGYLRSDLLRDYIDKQFSGDAVIQKKTDIIIQMDYLSPYSVDELSTMATTGTTNSRDLQFSAQLPVILDKIIRDKGVEWFLTATFDDIKPLVDAEFVMIKPPTIPIQNAE